MIIISQYLKQSEKKHKPKKKAKISDVNPLFHSIVVGLCLYGREGMPMTRNLMM